jgi:hypothetical protein
MKLFFLLFNFWNVLLVINQHSNFSHPKLITIPRGLPIKNVKDVIWKTMINISIKQKTKLLFSSASKSQSRIQIMNCISKNPEGPSEQYTSLT